MKKQAVWLLATLAALALVGCMNEKAPAEQAVASAESALVPIRDAARKYAPDQLQALDAQLATMKDNLAKGDYKAVVAAVPSFNTALGALRETAQAKQQEAEAAAARAKEAWGPLSTEVPRMVAAIQSRVDILSKSHHLPKGVTKDTLASAKSTLDSLKSAWSDAQNAATSGDFTNAVSKAQAVKDQAGGTMKSLGMTSS
jgi:hypothetical protein